MFKGKKRYTLCGLYVNADNRNEIVAYAMRSNNSTKIRKYTPGAMGYLCGLGLVDNCTATIYRGDLMLCGKGVSWSDFPVKYVKLDACIDVSDIKDIEPESEELTFKSELSAVDFMLSIYEDICAIMSDRGFVISKHNIEGNICTEVFGHYISWVFERGIADGVKLIVSFRLALAADGHCSVVAKLTWYYTGSCKSILLDRNCIDVNNREDVIHKIKLFADGSIDSFLMSINVTRKLQIGSSVENYAMDNLQKFFNAFIHGMDMAHSAFKMHELSMRVNTGNCKRVIGHIEGAFSTEDGAMPINREYCVKCEIEYAYEYDKYRIEAGIKYYEEDFTRVFMRNLLSDKELLDVKILNLILDIINMNALGHMNLVNQHRLTGRIV